MSCYTPGVRLCVRNILGKIVTDANLTIYSVLFPSLLSHTYYSSLSLLRMHKLHSPIFYPPPLVLQMHNFLFFFQNLLSPTVTLIHPSFSCFSSTLLQIHKLHFSISLLLIFVVVSCSRILSPLSNKRKQEVRQLNICLLAMLLAFSSKQSTEHVLASFVASYVCSSSAHTRLTDQGKNNRV